MGEGNSRNKPCWCGSGKKTKHCHLNREEQPSVQWWDAEKQLRKNFSQKKCSVPSAIAENCTNKIIRAHTIPRSSSLEAIARDGHVYAFVLSLKNLKENNGRIEPVLQGIKKASTFTGFCSIHDDQIFAPVENEPFVCSAEQCFLLGYRAVSREIYTKEAAVDSSPIRQDADKGQPLHIQQQIQSFNTLFDTGSNAGLKDIIAEKNRYDGVLIKGEFSDSRAYVIQLRNPPPVMCSGGWLPTHDLEGNKLQDLANLTNSLFGMTCSAISSAGKGFIVFQWLSHADEVATKFIDSLQRIEDAELSVVMTVFMFEQFENIFMSPDWWEKLDSGTRTSLVNRMTSFANPLMLRGQNPYGAATINVAPWEILQRKAIGY